MFDINGDNRIDERDLDVVLNELGKNDKLTAEQKGTIINNIITEGAQGKAFS